MRLGETAPVLPQASRVSRVQEYLESLHKEVNRLSAKLDTVAEQVLSLLAEEAQQLSFVHTSPDFHNSAYGAKVISIKDTVGAMLQRAQHSIRISTRQMDMFADDLIALKRRNPGLEITVLSRGPDGQGDRRKIAGVAHERMKEAGIKLPIEKDVLHSRIVVIDEQEVLVSSADLDFTQMELEFNAGIWTSNPDVVAEAIGYFDNLLKLPTVVLRE
jgi:phosphatidylserine/phosphatidylglycerophosphate/cardiolipin synthase-like enzyme